MIDPCSYRFLPQSVRFDEHLSTQRIQELGLEDFNQRRDEEKVDGLAKKLLEKAPLIQGNWNPLKGKKAEAKASIDFLHLFCLFAHQSNGVSKRNLAVWQKRNENKIVSYHFYDPVFQEAMQEVAFFASLLQAPKKGSAFRGTLKPHFNQLTSKLDTLFIKNLSPMEQVATGKHMGLAINTLRRHFKIK